MDPRLPAGLMRRLATPPPQRGRRLDGLLELLETAARKGFDATGEGYLAFVPGGGLYTAAVADFVSLGLNRFVNNPAAAPAFVQIEQSVTRWMCDLVGLPPASQGVLTSGGSVAQLSAVITAREARVRGRAHEGRIYVSDQAHHSIAKAARLAGLPHASVRQVRTTADLRLDVEHLSRSLKEDRDRGHRPFMVVGTAGTTNTGAVDDLPAVADLAAREGLWFHVDAAYGGFFLLTARGRQRMRGIERADSVALDPHKSLFLPYGTGALLVRDGELLRAAHSSPSPEYLALARDASGIPDLADYSIELSRDFRGLRVWLPLQLHGVAAFRSCLDSRLDWAERLFAAVHALPGYETPWPGDLATVAFRCSRSAPADADAATRQVLAAVNRSRRVMVSSTTIGGRPALHACLLSHRVTAERVDALLEILTRASFPG